MDASSQPPRSRQQFPPNSSRISWWLALPAVGLLLLTWLMLQVSGFSQPGIVYGASQTHFDATAQPSPSATQGVPPTLTLMVPSSAQGPVGAHITITGSNWGATDVLVGVANPGVSCADPNSWVQTFTHVRPQSDQSIVFAFDWPTGLSSAGGAYSICASNDAGVANVSYQVLSSSPPTLTLDPIQVAAGALVKVTGANFVGSGQITLTVTDGQGKTRELTTLSPDATGAFSLQFQPRPTDVGDEVLHAFSGGAPTGMKPAVQADAKLHVGPAATPTAAPSPTVAVAAVPPPSQGSGPSKALVAVLVIGLLLALLVVGGAIVYFVMRNRRGSAGGDFAESGYYGASSPGYSKPGNIYSDMNQGTNYGTAYGPGMGGMDTGGWDAPTVGGYPTYQQGGYPPQPEYGSNEYSDGTGGWPESDEPDPGWRPRPMTGRWQTYDDDPAGGYKDYRGSGGDESGRYPPPDPWGDPGASQGQPRGPSGRPYGSGQSYRGGQRGGSGGGYPPPGQGGQPPSGPRSGPRSRGSSSGGGGRRSSSGGPPEYPEYPRERYPDQPPDGDW